MYEQIFGKVSVFLSRDFLARGLLPAATILILLGGLIAGPVKYVSTAATVLSAPGHRTEALIAATLVLLFASGLFAVFSHLSFSALDGSLLPQSYRERLRRTYESRRRGLQEEIDQLETYATLLGWIGKNENPLDAPPFVPPLRQTIELERATAGAADALTILRELDTRNSQYPRFRSSLEVWQRERLKSGLQVVQVLLCSKPRPAPLVEWFTECVQILRRDYNLALLDELDKGIRQEWASKRVQLSKQFPGPRAVKPTRLGNVLAALDEYGLTRYGIPTSLIWSRVWWLLGDSERASVATSKLGIDSGVNFTIALGLAAIGAAVLFCLRLLVIATGLSVTMTVPPLVRSALFAVVVAGCAWISYRTTVESVATLADKVSGLLDVHRLECLLKLGFGPKTLQVEQQLLEELRVFLGQGSPLGEAGKTAYVGVTAADASSAPGPQPAGQVGTVPKPLTD